MSAIFNVAGGFRYHFRGWRSSGRWRPFRDAVSSWLAAWRPGGERLLIVGASGGYCLRMQWLAGFSEVVCLDPDPMARAIFARRLRRAAPATRLVWHLDNFLAASAPAEQVRIFEAFLARYPGAPVLFSNFLGQLSLLMQERGIDPDTALPHWKSHLASRSLANRAWASFHDRFSGEVAPQFAQPLARPERMSDAQVVSELYARASAPRARITGLAELADHDTDGLFPAGREHVYFHWPLTRTWTHLIEATHS